MNHEDAFVQAITDAPDDDAVAPRGVDAAKAAALFDLPYRRLDSLGDLPAALATDTCLVEVSTDRQANVGEHRRLAEQVRRSLQSS